MKKFLAIFAAAAVVATAGFAVIETKKDKADTDNDTTSSYSQTQQNGGYTDNYSQTGESSEKSEEQTSETEAAAEGQHSFNCRIDSVSGMMLIVFPDENSAEYKSSDKIAFSLEDVAVTDENGSTVGYDGIGNYETARVVYSGGVMETYPAQIKAQKVVLSGQKYCNVNFVIDGSVVKTLKVKKGETVNAADMPNAGAYCADGYHFECWLDGDKSVSFISDISSDVTLTAKISKD